jgi:diamine N-acetyltransferase
MFRDAFGDSNDPAQMDAYCGDHYSEAIQRDELVDPEILVLFLEDEGGVVAYAQLRLRVPESEIWRFYVDRSQHGRGVAQGMMEEALEACREAGASEVVLAVWEHNPRAVAFYRKSGFEVVGEQPFILGEERQRDLVMRRAL